MLRMTVKQGFLGLAAVFAFAVVVPVAASAQSARAQEVQEQSRTLQSQQQGNEEARASGEERREAAKVRLEEAKLKACQKREKAITNIMARLSDRATKQLDVFSKISERTQAFYEDKGRTLENYDALVTEVDAKRVAAEAEVARTNEASTAFTCDGDDPKGVASSFKESLKVQNEALKAYKTAVKNLIVGVKSVQGTTSSADSRGSEGDQE